MTMIPLFQHGSIVTVGGSAERYYVTKVNRVNLKMKSLRTGNDYTVNMAAAVLAENQSMTNEEHERVFPKKNLDLLVGSVVTSDKMTDIGVKPDEKFVIVKLTDMNSVAHFVRLGGDVTGARYKAATSVLNLVEV